MTDPRAAAAGPPDRITALLDFMQWVVFGLAAAVLAVLLLSIALRIHRNRPAPAEQRDLAAVKGSLPTAQDKQWWDEYVMRPLGPQGAPAPLDSPPHHTVR